MPSLLNPSPNRQIAALLFRLVIVIDVRIKIAIKKSIMNQKPTLRHIANLWTLVWHPSKSKEWSLERKLRAVKDAGFDGFTTELTPEHARLADKLGLLRVGYFSSGNPKEFAPLLRQQKAAGAVHINVQ